MEDHLHQFPVKRCGYKMSLNIVTVSINGSAKEQLPTVGVVGVRILCSKKRQYAMLCCLYHITIMLHRMDHCAP